MQENEAYKPLYIVGAGSFAKKLAIVFTQHKIDFTFVDEIEKKTLCNINVVTAAEANIAGRFLIAISIPLYANNAINRLISHGVKRGQYLPLEYDSDCRMLEHMLGIDQFRLLSLLNSNLTSFSDLECKFFDSINSVRFSSNNNNRYEIAFACIGRGGGYLGHLGNLPRKVSKTHSSVLVSDSIIEASVDIPNPILMGQSCMLIQDDLDLVIAAHVFPCSPKRIKKLSLSHMVYDFLLYDKQTFEHLAQADTHYIFSPSAANMKMHQSICRQQGLSNNIVLIPGGYPKHDQNLIEYADLVNLNGPPNCILYAPTLSSLHAGNESDACFSIIDALEFLPQILQELDTIKLIFRPHPEDLALIDCALEHPRAKAFVSLVNWCNSHSRCEIDTDKNRYLDSFSRSAAIITDTSSVGFSFSLITGRPTLFYSNNHQSLETEFESSQFIHDRTHFGYLVDSLSSLLAILRKSLDNEVLVAESNHQKQAFCKTLIYNSGTSEDYLIENLDYILQDIKHPDWWYLQDHLES